MDSLTGLANGLVGVLQPEYLLYALLGCLLGNLIGVLPGLGPVGGIAVLIPLTFHLEVTGAVIMLAAIYYGAMYGGTITSVLMNVPGEAASAVTCFDGYPMAKQGRAGVALTIAAAGSFVGGMLSLVFLTALGPPLSKWALSIGPPEIFALMVLALTLVTTLAGRSPTKGAIMAFFGLLLATVGMDSDVGVPRLTFGQAELLSGLSFTPVFIGLFGLGEILLSVERRVREGVTESPRSLMPGREDVRRSAMPVVRGSGLGFILGLVPGVGSVTPTFISYAMEKRLSRRPQEFGKGAIEGVAGPETTNNSYVVGALVPLLTLGIPANATIAVLMGAFIMNGITPGPFLFQDHPDLVWTLIAALFLGSFILLILNVPLVRVWVRLLTIPYPILISLMVGVMVVGAYTVTNSVFSIWVFLAFGVLGYAFKKADLPLAPLAMTFVLGGIVEENLTRSLQMSQGDFGIFLERPAAGVLLALTALIAVALPVRTVIQNRRKAREGVDAHIREGSLP